MDLKIESDEVLFLMMDVGREGEKQAAFGEFYRRYSHFIWRVCLRWCHSVGRPRSEAEDFVCDVAYHIFQNAGKYDPPDETKEEVSTKAWIGRVTRNYLLDQLRKISSPRVVSIDDDDGVKEALTASELAETPHKYQSAVEEAIAALPERDQDVVRGYLMLKDPTNPAARGKQGHTEQLARELGMTQAGLRQRYSRALKRIREHVAARFPELKEGEHNETLA